MKKVLIVNQGKSDNIGDKAIDSALTNFFKEIGYDVTSAGYTQFVNMEIGNIDVSNHQAVRRIDLPIFVKWFLKKKWMLRKELKKYENEYDIFILGGGQLVKSNCYFPMAFAEWSRFAQKNAKQKYVVGVGIDSNLTPKDKKIYRRYLGKYNKVWVRDHKSKEYVYKELNTLAEFIPDVAFLTTRYIQKTSQLNDEQYVMVMIFDYNTYKIHFKNEKTYDEYLDYWTKIVEHEVGQNKRVVLGYTTAEDKKQTILFYEKLKETYGQYVKMSEISNLQELLSEIGKVDKVYSARMHALILSMVLKKEVHCVAISEKLRNFETDYLEKNIDVEEVSEKIFNTLRGIK